MARTWAVCFALLTATGTGTAFAQPRIPQRVRDVAEGTIDPLQQALVASAALKAGIPTHLRPDTGEIVSVLRQGPKGLSESARLRGLTVQQIRVHAHELFGPSLFVRTARGMVAGTPAGEALERLRAEGSYAYMAAWPRKRLRDELSSLATAYMVAVGPMNGRNHQECLALLRFIVPLLLKNPIAGAQAVPTATQGAMDRW